MDKFEEAIRYSESEMFDSAMLELCPKNYCNLKQRDKVFYEEAFRAGMKYAVRHLRVIFDVMEER